MRELEFNHVGKTIAIDNFVHDGPNKRTNRPIHTREKVVKYWHVPSDNPRHSGQEFVKLEDGKVYMRYDSYTPFSPYGWSLAQEYQEPVAG